MPDGDINDDYLDAMIEAALRRPADAPIPPGFAARTLVHAPQPEKSVLPYAIVAACAVFALVAAWVLHTGLLAATGRWIGDAIAQRAVLAALAALEIAGALAWLWRAARA